ncbi:MAG TPA: VCBS repeat-containing protein [Polyangiaceae bacterium]|nr:VCBS repeat-containing protein [Polyangiaceae bacterium]
MRRAWHAGFAVAPSLWLAVAGAGCSDRKPSSATDCAGASEVGFEVRELLPRPHANYRATSGNVRFQDLDGDGTKELFVHEAGNARITVLSDCTPECVEQVFSEGLRVPVRSHVVDLERDGDRDLLVSDIGSMSPSDERVGRVVVLRSDSRGGFIPEVLAENLGRVVSTEAADLDGDGDEDIVVCEFGHESVGSLFWLEQADGSFERRELEPVPGAIHGFPVDLDADGDADIAAIFSQDAEDVRLYRNGGSGSFTSELLFAGGSDDFGMSGLEPTDLDQDGDIDLLVTNGDYLDTVRFEDDDTFPELHGLAWLENIAGAFVWHDVLRTPAAYTVRAADLDGDCDRDLVLGSLVRTEVLPGRYRPPPLLWLENDGAQAFSVHPLLETPQPLVSIDIGDVDADGRLEIAFGDLGDNVRGTRASIMRLHGQP